MTKETQPAPSAEEIDKLRKDASEGDPNAADALKHGDKAEEGLRKWREAQIPAD